MWKLRVGVEHYYLAQVASGLDDYYTGAGEAPGTWVGEGTRALDLGGDVDADALRAVLAGLRPGTGLTPNGITNRPHVRRVPGFDLTFSAPKSVSLLYALGDPLVQGAVIDACEHAVDEAFGWLEREACWVRRGSNDQNRKSADADGWGTRRMATRGFVSARFRHRTSRAGDPQLHWHVLVANLAQGIDGRWSALDGTALYRAKRAAGVMFQTAVRRELTVRLGVRWGPMHDDLAEIAGIPRRVLRAFSERREQIEEWMDVHGRSGAAAAQEATLATRSAKTVTDAADLRADWIARAEALGWGPDRVEMLLADASPGERIDRIDTWHLDHIGDDGHHVTRVVSFDEWLGDVLVNRLVAGDSSFSRLDLAQAIASRLPVGASSDVIDSIIHRALASTLIVPLHPHPDDGHRPGRIIGPIGEIDDPNEQRWTARMLLDTEARFLTHFANTSDAPAPVPTVIVERIVASRATIGADQADVVRALTGPGPSVRVLVGRAGTGKTYTLGAVRDAYERAGWTVHGLAPSARAARELAIGAGLDARTNASWIVANPPIGRDTLLLVDEAGMCGTFELGCILDRATTFGARVILVGDHHQLPEIAAGGGLRAAIDQLASRPGGVCELTVNRRQREAWEHDALDHLRHGDLTTAWTAYKAHARVVLAGTRVEVHEAMLADAWRYRAAGDDVVMLAGTRAEAAALNRRARHQYALAGLLTGPALDVDGRIFQTGDRVVLLHNDRLPQPDHTTAAVYNGMTGTITAVDVTRQSLTMTVTGTGQLLRIDRNYLNGGWVDHGYATTIHKAQGLTCDRVLVAGPHGLTREAVYVALSRARKSACLYATVRDDADLTERHARGIPLPTEQQHDPETEILTRLGRSGAKTFASSVDRDARCIATLADNHTTRQLVAAAERARHAETCAPTPDPQRVRRQLELAVAFRTHADIGRRVRVLDRNNVGTISAIDDDDGTAHITFCSPSGRTKQRDLPWWQLVVLDNPDAVALDTAARQRVDHYETVVTELEQAWAEHLAGHGFAVGDAGRYDRALQLVSDRTAHHLATDPPAWLTVMLGSRPNDQAGAIVWDDAVGRLAAWRTDYHLTTDTTGVGPCPPDGDPTFESWHETQLDLLRVRGWLNQRPDQPPPTQHRKLTPTELVYRLEQLNQIIATAPADQQALIEHLLSAERTAGALHQVLTAAANAQHHRRRWILEHWPHLVEHHEITNLIAANEPLAHWPTALPEPVTAILNTLARSASPPACIEERTLHQLDELARGEHPVTRLAGQLDDIVRQRNDVTNRLATTQPGSVEHDINVADLEALHRQTRIIAHDLAAARRAERDAELLNSYTGQPPDRYTQARKDRIATLTHQTLATQPVWLVNLVQHLHDSGQLPASDEALVEHVARLAAYRDRWNIAADDPYGPDPTSNMQHIERRGLEPASPPAQTLTIPDLMQR